MAYIPGSQARLWVAPPPIGSNSTPGTGVSADRFQVFRFSEANVTVRAPRIDGTNSEGLPGAVRGDLWSMVGLNPARRRATINPAIRAAPAFPGIPARSSIYPTFKEMPHETQLPGVSVVDIEVEQMTWDVDQIIFGVTASPAAAAPAALIVPQRYISMVIAPNWQQTRMGEIYVFFSVYIEETPHRINPKQNQPARFRGYSNGPFILPGLIGVTGTPNGFPATLTEADFATSTGIAG